VLWLTSARTHERDLRLLEVMKMRGSDFLSGKHAYRLSADGVRIFPRLADPAESSDYSFDGNRISSGLEALDDLLDAGYRSGSATLVAGPSGAGKTVFGMQFTFEGVKNHEKSIFTTFEENPSQLARTAAGFGWSFEDPDVSVMYRSSVDLYLDEWVYDLLEQIESEKASRVFVDGMASLRNAASDGTRFREYIYSLVQRCSRQSVSLMMSLETPELFGVARLSDVALSQLADNVILLQFIRHPNEYRRGLTLLKTRGGRTDPYLREYAIDSDGIRITARPIQ
jgi:circadian clock protein KaiC